MRTFFLVAILLISFIKSNSQNKSLVDYYSNIKKQEVNIFNDKLFNTKLRTIKDTLPIKIYNSYFKKPNQINILINQKLEPYIAINKSSIEPLEFEDWSKGFAQKELIYNKIYPLFKIQEKSFVNLFNLHYGPDRCFIEIIVMNNNNELISGLVLVKGESHLSKKEMISPSINTVIENDRTYKHTILSMDLKTVSIFHQNDEGYFVLDKTDVEEP